MEELESADLQGKRSSSVPPSYGGAPTRGRAHEGTPDRVAPQRAWLDAGHWTEDPLTDALLSAFPMTSIGDLPALLQHADQLATLELGGDAT